MGKEAKYIVRLTDEERQTLQQLVVGPRVARDKALRARMLLNGRCRWSNWPDQQIAEAFEVGGPPSIDCASGWSRTGWRLP